MNSSCCKDLESSLPDFQGTIFENLGCSKACCLPRATPLVIDFCKTNCGRDGHLCSSAKMTRISLEYWNLQSLQGWWNRSGASVLVWFVSHLSWAACSCNRRPSIRVQADLPAASRISPWCFHSSTAFFLPAANNLLDSEHDLSRCSGPWYRYLDNLQNFSFYLLILGQSQRFVSDEPQHKITEESETSQTHSPRYSPSSTSISGHASRSFCLKCKLS